mmetsp:Transcript_128683/g.222317  ORF Transcript_128683/g.222317 Transcript_128683/m.222317 type:complete len:289 (+) Transcript_128683:1169-2035(+)
MRMNGGAARTFTSARTSRLCAWPLSTTIRYSRESAMKETRRRKSRTGSQRLAPSSLTFIRARTTTCLARGSTCQRSLSSSSKRIGTTTVSSSARRWRARTTSTSTSVRSWTRRTAPSTRRSLSSTASGVTCSQACMARTRTARSSGCGVTCWNTASSTMRRKSRPSGRSESGRRSKSGKMRRRRRSVRGLRRRLRPRRRLEPSRPLPPSPQPWAFESATGSGARPGALPGLTPGAAWHRAANRHLGILHAGGTTGVAGLQLPECCVWPMPGALQLLTPVQPSKLLQLT